MIPVFEPVIGEEEISAVVDALRKGELSGSFGSYIPEFEKAFAQYCGCNHGVAVTSGTTSLHLAVAAAGIKPGDEVLVSASTNIASALAIFHNGAIPVPVDSENKMWNLDIDLVESLITPHTRAIIPVHLFGHPVDMVRLKKICEKHNLIIIEDCAESHGATCHGKMTGSFGDMSCFSFYSNKIITTGEGGMVVTNNKEYADKLKILRNLAFTTPRFMHQVAGYNFRMTGYQAAMGLEQLKKIDNILSKKRTVAELYNKYLRNTDGITTPVEAKWAKNIYWMYGIVIRPGSAIARDDLMNKLYERGIETRTFFYPMNLQPCFEEIYKKRPPAPCPVAEYLWKNGCYLPSSINLGEDQIKFICDAIKDNL